MEPTSITIFDHDYEFCTRCDCSIVGKTAVRGRWKAGGVDVPCCACEDCTKELLALVESDPAAEIRFREELGRLALLKHGSPGGRA